MKPSHKVAPIAAALAFLATSVCAQTTAKPPVPSGIDPGGELVALIGEGVDYTQPELAARLARDGEGEIVGWDLHDKDRRPYGIDFLKGFTTRQSAAAVAMVGQPGKTRLAVFRVTQSDGWLDETAAAIAMAASTRTRLIVLPANLPQALIEEATKRFPTQLFLVPTFRGWDTEYAHVVKVTNSASCKQSYASEEGDTWPLSADIATDSGCFTLPMLNTTYPLAETAVGRIAALAARILSMEPKLSAAELKVRIVGLARPFTSGTDQMARHGRIEDPSAHYAPK
jgi:hypothetical protein